MWSGDGLLVTDCYIFGYKTGCIFRLVVYGVGANGLFLSGHTGCLGRKGCGRLVQNLITG